MDKKNVIVRCLLIFCVALIVATVVFLCLKNKDGEIRVSSRPLNETVNLEEVFEKIKLIDGMMPRNEMYSGEEFEGNPDMENRVDGNQKTWADEEEIDFGKYTVLEKKAIVNTTDDSINEVWMIKLGSYKQQEDVCRIFGTRVNKLKAGFKDNAVQSRVLDEAVIKQEDGIVIMIISPEVRTIEETIAKEMGHS